jgi:hypothetical protein
MTGGYLVEVIRLLAKLKKSHSEAFHDLGEPSLFYNFAGTPACSLRTSTPIFHVGLASYGFVGDSARVDLAEVQPAASVGSNSSYDRNSAYYALDN